MSGRSSLLHDTQFLFFFVACVSLFGLTVPCLIFTRHNDGIGMVSEFDEIASTLLTEDTLLRLG